MITYDVHARFEILDQQLLELVAGREGPPSGWPIRPVEVLEVNGECSGSDHFRYGVVNGNCELSNRYCDLVVNAVCGANGGCPTPGKYIPHIDVTTQIVSDVINRPCG